MLPDPVKAAIRHIADKAEGGALPANTPVTLNFHPDAICSGKLMIAALAEDGIYPGFRLPESRISDCVDYRGEEIAALACRLVNNGFITPYDIGLARRKNYDPQHLKMLWHCTAKFGSPIPE